MSCARHFVLISLVTGMMALANVANAQPQPLRFPASSNNVLFVDGAGNIVYGVVNLHVTDFLGVPVVGGTLWERRTNRLYAFAAVQTANPRKWVWLTNSGPAGTVTNGEKLHWADNRQNRGCVIPF